VRGPAEHYSLAAMSGMGLEPLLAPLASTGRCGRADPGMAARSRGGARSAPSMRSRRQGSRDQIGQVARPTNGPGNRACRFGVVQSSPRNAHDARRHPPRDQEAALDGHPLYVMLALAYVASCSTFNLRGRSELSCDSAGSCAPNNSSSEGQSVRLCN